MMFVIGETVVTTCSPLLIAGLAAGPQAARNVPRATQIDRTRIGFINIFSLVMMWFKAEFWFRSPCTAYIPQKAQDDPYRSGTIAHGQSCRISLSPSDGRFALPGCTCDKSGGGAAPCRQTHNTSGRRSGLQRPDAFRTENPDCDRPWRD